MSDSTNERVSLQVAIEGKAATAGAAQVVKATDKIKKGARDADVQIDRLEKDMMRLSKTARALAGPLTTLFAGIGAVRGLQVAGRTIANFETTMVTLGGVSRATAEDMERLKKTARDFGASTRFSATEAGEGLLFLARAGFSTNDSIAALGSTLDLAQAGQLDLGTAADFASNIVSQFGLTASETVRVVDDLVVVANRANTSVSQMAQAMVFAGPISQALGVSLETTAAAIGVLGDSGIQSTKAGRGLRGMMLALAGPTTAAQKVFERLDLSLEDIDPTANDLSVVLGRLKDASLEAGDAAKIFGRENVGAALVLTRSIDKLRELEQAQKDNVGEANKLARMQEDTLGGAAKELISTVQELTLRIGDGGLKGAMRIAVDGSTELLRAIGGIDDDAEAMSMTMKILAVQIKAVGVAIGTFATVSVVTSVFRLAKNTHLVARGINAITVAMAKNPVAILATAAAIGVVELTGLVDALSDTGDEVKNLRNDVFDFKNAIDQLEGLEGVVSRAFSIGEPALIKRAFENVRNVLVTQAENLSNETSAESVALSKLVDFIPENIATRIGVSTAAISTIAEKERDIALEYFQEQKKFFEDQQALLTGVFDGQKILQLESLIGKVNNQIKDLNDAPLGEEMISRTDALKFVEDAIGGINEALVEQQTIIDSAPSDNGAGVLDANEVSDALVDMQGLRSELEKQSALVGKNAAESVQYENALRALAAAANVPFMERIEFLFEINGLTDDLLGLQRDLVASDLISAQRDEIAILNLKKEGLTAEAELLRQTITLRMQGIELTDLEKTALLDLIRQRQALTVNPSGKSSRVDQLFRELDFEKELIGLTNDERERAIKLRDLESAAIDEQIPNIEDLVEQYKMALEELQKLREMEELGKAVGDSIGDALADIVTGAKSAEEAFESLYKAIAKLFFQQFVTNQISGALNDLFAGFGSNPNSGSPAFDGPNTGGNRPEFALGGAFESGYQVRLARGDILTGPTNLSTARGPALGGEAGPEAIMPLKRDSQGRLGVVAGRGGGSGAPNITINMAFAPGTNVADFEESTRQMTQRLNRTLRNN